MHKIKAYLVAQAIDPGHSPHWKCKAFDPISTTNSQDITTVRKQMLQGILILWYYIRIYKYAPTVGIVKGFEEFFKVMFKNLLYYIILFTLSDIKSDDDVGKISHNDGREGHECAVHC